MKNEVSKTPSNTQTWLLFNGPDTSNNIESCEQPVAAKNNQFSQYYFNISTLLGNYTSPNLSINFQVYRT